MNAFTEKCETEDKLTRTKRIMGTMRATMTTRTMRTMITMRIMIMMTMRTISNAISFQVQGC